MKKPGFRILAVVPADNHEGVTRSACRTLDDAWALVASRVMNEDGKPAEPEDWLLTEGAFIQVDIVDHDGPAITHTIIYPMRA